MLNMHKRAVLLLSLLAGYGPTLFAAAADERLSVPLTVPDSLTPDEQPEPLAANASLATCPVASQFVDVCIDSAMDIRSAGGGLEPPDPHGAAGPNSLIAVTNVAIECLRKNGTTIFGPTQLLDMFASLKPIFLFDPKIRYDVHQGRFVIVALDGNFETYSSIVVAVSKTSDPTTTTSQDWFFMKINSLVNGYAADYPGLAVDEEAIYITANMFGIRGGFKSFVWIIDKSNFYAGKTPVWKIHDYIAKANAGIYNTHMPAMVRNATGIPNNVGTYLVAYGGYSVGKKEYMQIVEIKNPLAKRPTFRVALVKIGDIDTAGSTFIQFSAPQAGSSKRLAAGDQRMYDAVWANNALWMVTSVQRPTTGAVAAYWIKILADGVTWPPTPLDHGPIDGTKAIGKGTYTFFPSIDVNSKGVVAFGFAASSRSMYGSAYATIRDDTIDARGTVRTADLVRTGEGPYGGYRWGDYSSVSMDPTNNDCFWTFNQYAKSPPKLFWKTAWARLCYTSPTAQPTKAPTLTPTMAPTVTMAPSTTMKPTNAPTFTKAPTMTPTMAPTIACYNATTPCIFNATSTKNVCCDAQQLVCRKAKAGQPFTCLKCLPSGKPCKPATAYQCCSKKCNLATRTCRK